MARNIGAQGGPGNHSGPDKSPENKDFTERSSAAAADIHPRLKLGILGPLAFPPGVRKRFVWVALALALASVLAAGSGGAGHRVGPCLALDRERT
jgi:hypothetical protein